MNFRPSYPQFRQVPEVVFQPRTYRGMQRGINTIVAAVRPTLGPQPRNVAIQPVAFKEAPELLDNAAVITRRIVELPDGDANAGAMLLRGMLWSLYERVGDGTATAAVLYQSIFNQGLKYIVAGGNAMILRQYLEEGLELVLEALEGQTVPVSGQDSLAGVARTVCYDPQMAEALGKIFDVIGEFGILEIRAGRRRDVVYEYIEGSYWSGGLHTAELITDIPNQRTRCEQPAILLSDLELNDPNALVPVLQATVENGFKTLVIVSSKVSEAVKSIMLRSRGSDKLQVIGVKTPGSRSDQQMAALDDLAVLTGGRPLYASAGDTLESFTPQHFGSARRLWASREHLGLVRGQGDPRRLRQHVAQLRKAYAGLKKAEDRHQLQERIGRLLGASAAIDVGGVTESEVEVRKELARRTADTLRGAVRQGVLPGGGSALLACRPALQTRLAQASRSEERAAYRILLTSLEVPYRTILENAGYDPSALAAQLEQAGPGFGFDVLSGQVVEMLPAGILDVAAVQIDAVFSAVRSAALALTIDTLVHRKKPPVASSPDGIDF
ncbi:MAG: hypothetical protein JW862_01745 [Anaerolineales bacterium]|nr:hypothetical protein [Anaerolineales bacterium]